MEGMPRLPMLAPELKQPANDYDDSFVMQIKEYIIMHFQADPCDFDDALSEIRTMKKSMTRMHSDVEAACTLKRYYAQLLMMKNRFPMESGDPIRVIYSWFERATELPSAHTHDDVMYELACTMYQVGAVHGNIAARETRQTEDGIKNAFMHFQYAAWPFQNLRDTMDLARFSTLDFDKDLLTFYVNILLGEAQECLVEKSLIDHRNSIVVAKLSIYLRDLYLECHKLLLNSSVGEIVSSSRFKMWSRTCLIKSEIYGCTAMLYMGMKADEEQKYGDRLGYYQAANEYLQRAIKCCEKEDREAVRDSVRFVSDVIVAKLENAKKENDFIYHERIPKIEDLYGSVEGLCKVKPLSFDPLDPSVGGDDIFAALLPPTVLTAVSQYEEEKSKLKRDVLDKVSAKDSELQAFLMSLNISELNLDAAPGDVRLPDMLLERNASLNSQNDAVPKLLDQLQRVNELSREADAKLSGLIDRLALVDLPELTVDEGYQAVKKEVARLNDHHLQARSNNAELHKALAAQTANLTLLSLPYRELTSRLAAPQVAPGSTKEGLALSRILEKTNEMQQQRLKLIQRLSDELASDNIAKRLLNERDSDSKESFAIELRKHDQTLKYIDQNLSAQATILFHLTEANADFAEQRRLLQETNKSRSEQVLTLVSAFDVYSEVCHKAEDGTRFYEKLIDRVNKLGIAVEGIETEYAEEKRKREDEKRALEEKMSALRAARDARDAMADFGTGGSSYRGGPPFSTSTSQISPEQPEGLQSTPRGGRPRLGDYMDFYRNKMARGGQPMPAPVLPPSASGPQMSYQQHGMSDHPTNTQYISPSFPSPGPPSPAPSSIADYHYSPRFDASSLANQQYAQPSQSLNSPHPGYAGPPQPPQYNAPNHQSYQQVQPQYSVPPQHYQQPMPPRAAVNIPSLPLHPHYQDPVRYADQTPLPPQAYVALSQPQYHSMTSHTVTPSYLPGGHYTNQGNPSAPVQVYMQQHQQYVLPPTSSHQIPPVQPNYQHPQPVAQAQPSSPFRPLEPAYNHVPVSPVTPVTVHAAQPPVIPQADPVPQQMPPQQQWPTYQPAPHQPSHNGYGQPPLQQTPVASQQPHIPPPAINHNTSVASQVFSQVTDSNVTPPQAKSQPNLSQSASLPPVTQQQSAPTNQQFVPAGPSPWHRAPPQAGSQSPWHAGAASQMAGFAHSSAPVAPQNVGQIQQSASSNMYTYGQQLLNGQMQQPMSGSGSANVDLLSSLLGDLHLPPPIQPSAAYAGAAMETQSLQRAAPVNSGSTQSTQSLSQISSEKDPRVSLSGSQPVQSRPAATVLPMQHHAPAVHSPSPVILSMVTPSTISVPPQPPICAQKCGAVAANAKPNVNTGIGLTDVLDPAKFTIGSGDATRLEKRQLHAAIRNEAPRPPLDPRDPLNQLDPFWKAH